MVASRIPAGVSKTVVNEESVLATARKRSSFAGPLVTRRTEWVMTHTPSEAATPKGPVCFVHQLRRNHIAVFVYTGTSPALELKIQHFGREFVRNGQCLDF